METSNKVRHSTEYKTVRRKFIQSVLKWSAEDFVVEEDKPADSPDVGDLVNILRSVGFKLRQFESCNEKDGISASTSSLNSAKCKVEITCGHSGLKATLESVVGVCRCPSVESAVQAQIWHVCGSTPATRSSNESLSNMQEAGSNLVPPLPSAMEDVVRDILARVLNLMCDPKVADLDTSSRSITGERNISHHRSLDNITIPELHSKASNGSGLTFPAGKDKKQIVRAVSSTDLPTCPLSPVIAALSPGDTMKQEGTWSIITASPPASPATNLSSKLDKMSITEKNAIFYRLEVAKRSIDEAMSMLNVKPLSLDHPKKKLGLEHTSTPTSRARRTVRTPITAAIAKSPASPKSVKKTQVTGFSRRLQGTPSTISKLLSASSGRASVIPVPRKMVGRTTSSLSAASSVSDYSSSTASTPKKVLGITPKLKRNVTPASCKKQNKVTENVKTDISTGSTSSASSSSSKTRILKDVVRRVARLSGGSDCPQSKNKEL